jgi:HSP20 family protein
MSLLNSLIPSFSRPLAHRGSAGGTTTPSLKPIYEVKETDEGFALTVYLPGVSKEGLTLTAEENVLTIRGERAWKQPSSWTLLYRESADLPYQLTLEHENLIDLDRIQAELRDGVLRVALPKTEAVKPRKIAVG